MWLAIPCACALSLLPQEPGPALVEVPGGIRITEDAYRGFLRTALGGARLEELLFDRILERECAALPAADVASVLADPGAAARERIDRQIATEYRGDRDAWRAALAARGVTPSEALLMERVLALREARIAALVAVERVPTEADLRRAFETRYGPDGVATRARHVLVSVADTRQRLAAARRGAPLPDDAVRAVARAEADRIAGRARAAGGLEALGPIPVPDGFEQFAGEAFARAMRELPEGAISEPIESRFGFHVLEVLGREVTRYEDVADAVRREWLRAPPTLAERRRLRERLYAEYGVREALAKRGAR